MSEQEDTNPQWSRHLEGIAEELRRLAHACDVKLRESGVIERVIKNDITVCGRKNEPAFEKLRKLLMATFDSLGKAIGRIGAAETRKITEAIRKHADQQRESGK